MSHYKNMHEGKMVPGGAMRLIKPAATHKSAKGGELKRSQPLSALQPATDSMAASVTHKA